MFLFLFIFLLYITDFAGFFYYFIGIGDYFVAMIKEKG